MLKNILAFSILFFLAVFAHAQDSLNMIRLARWDDDALPIASPGNLNLQYSGCWGLVVNNHEIAVLGGARHVLFFDVTEPGQPELIGKFEGTNTTVWREFKSYQNRVYGVADNSTEGLMIFDLTNAPDTIVRTYWSNEFFNSSHTITLDTVSGRIYLNGSNAANQGLVVLDVSQNPDQPEMLSAVNVDGGYIHDSYVRGDTIYASSGYEGYYVIDMRDPAAPVTLAQISTGGYNHNSWLSTDGRYAYYTEEIPQGRAIKIVDLQELATGSIEIADEFLDPLTPNSGPLAIPHNVYIRDSLLFDSQYEDGLLVYNIANPIEPVLVAYYDTHPQNVQYNSYYGNWGNYPWFPSGTIVAGDMQNGLQVLKIQNGSTGATTPGRELRALIMPNPASGQTAIRVPGTTAAWSYRLFSPAGQTLRQVYVGHAAEAVVPVGELAPGLYFVEIQDENGRATTHKLIVK